MLTDQFAKKTCTLQVKFSKDFNPTYGKAHLKENIKGAGWWTLNRDKITNSKADFWVFVIYSFGIKTNDFLIIRPLELLSLFEKLERKKTTIQSYFTVTNQKTAFEARDLSTKVLADISQNVTLFPDRDVTTYLNNWGRMVHQLA